MSHIDGNVLAGVMSELFDFDITITSGTCSGCGDDSVLAKAMVYSDAPGIVARCSACGGVLLVIVSDGERTWMNLHGIDELRISSRA